jgi:hypothetical protein
MLRFGFRSRDGVGISRVELEWLIGS